MAYLHCTPVRHTERDDLIQRIQHHCISLGNIFNILPYAQGSDLSCTYSNVAYHYCRFMIGHSLWRIGMCMEEHTCEARLPHINGNVVRK